MEWDLANDNAKLSDVIDVAFAEGPQTIVVGGRRLTVTPQVPADADETSPDFRSATHFKDWLLAIPRIDDLDIVRDKSPMREVDL